MKLSIHLVKSHGKTNKYPALFIGYIYIKQTPLAPSKYKSVNRSDQKNASADDINLDKGELITKEDGTHVIKVRKRKRRSKQVRKKTELPKMNPLIKWAIISILVGAVVTVGGGTLLITTKYNGAQFKQLIESNLTSTTGAKSATISALRITPIGAKSKKVSFEWAEDSFFHRAEFKSLTANINVTSFISNQWSGDDLAATTGIIHFKEPTNSSAEKIHNKNPNLYNYESVRLHNLSLFFGTAKDSPAIKELDVLIRKSESSQKYILQAGKIDYTNWPDVTLNSGIMIPKNDTVSLEAILISENKNNEITVSGNIPKSTDEPVSIELKSESYPIQEILNKDMSKMLRGPITFDSATLEYNYSKLEKDKLQLTIPFTSNELQMTRFPMFRHLKNLTADSVYIQPNFNRCSGTIIRKRQSTEIRNLSFISDSLLTISGDLYIAADGKMKGSLELKLPSLLFKNKKPANFTDTEDGFYSFDLKVGGSIYNPYDNFQELLSEYIETSPSDQQQTQPSTPTAQDFETLTE